MARSIYKLIGSVGLFLTTGLFFLIPGLFSLQKSLGSESAISPQPDLLIQSVKHVAKFSPPAETSVAPVDQTVRLEIHLSRRQVVLYRGTTQVKQYPIAVGRQGWETPTGNFEVIHVEQNPTWINPLTDERIPGGNSANPLGSYWIGFWTNGRNWIGFHGTPNPESVGRAVSHGCIRMYNEDIEELFYQVSIGTPVTVLE